MTDLHTAARQALEAWDCTVLPRAHDGMMQDRMECLRYALEQPKRDPCSHLSDADLMAMQPSAQPRRHISYVCPQCDASMVPAERPQQGCSECGVTSTDDSMHALYCVACIDKMQPQQEPVAWLVCSVNGDGALSLEHAAAWEEAAHEHINDAITEFETEGAAQWVVRPAYTHPPRREWVGLTEDEIYPLYSEPSSDVEMVEFARAIEAALKARNA